MAEIRQAFESVLSGGLCADEAVAGESDDEGIGR